MAIPALVDEDWQLLTTLLPEGWREMGWEQGALRNKKGITDPEILLRLLLLHVAGPLSLHSATGRAQVLGLPALTKVALFKRLRNAEEWLRTMAVAMFTKSRFASAVPICGNYRLRAVDATRIVEPGNTGSEWRVHFSIMLPELHCDFYEVTDVRGGETFVRFPVAKGDLILGDRGYSHRRGVAHVRRQGGDVLVRLNSTNFPLLDGRGRTFDLLAHLRCLDGHKARAWSVSFKHGADLFAARLCAVRKSKVAAERAKERIRQAAAKRQRILKPETLECAEYVFVLTTVAKEDFSAHAVLELYRSRWQIERVFKRMKSLMRLGHLPKKSNQSSRAWIQGKLLTVLLIERLLIEARFFSPWGFNVEQA
jgi:hypothetical protein